MGIGNRVKLYLYERHGKETVIHSTSAEEWDDFVLIRLDMSRDPNEQQDVLNQFSEYFPGKKVAIIPMGVDIEFYGVTVSPPLERTKND